MRSHKRVVLVCSEPLRETMAGIGIRYFEIARHLAEQDFFVKLLHPGKTPVSLAKQLGKVEFQRFSKDQLSQQLETFDVVIAQGHLGNHVAALPLEIAKVFDFYDPWLIENFSYLDSLGWKPFFNDLASWRLQFEKGDFFLCSSEEQQLYYLGFLTALGRVNPENARETPGFHHLIAPVPFGVPETLPPHRPLLSPAPKGQKRILFGGVYDWYDPWTLLQALSQLEDKNWQVYFVDNPNPETTPQSLCKDVKRWADGKGWLGERLVFLDWVPMERRYDLIRDVDVLVAPHRQSLETRLCMRTRYLDAIASGCPAISSAGGTIASLFHQYQAGAVVENENAEALANKLRDILWEGQNFIQGSQKLKQALSWSQVLEPLVTFCRQPSVDQGKSITLTLKQETGFLNQLRGRLSRLFWRQRSKRSP